MTADNSEAVLDFLTFMSDKIIDSKKLLDYVDSEIDIKIDFFSQIDNILTTGSLSWERVIFDGGRISMVNAIFKITSELFNIKNIKGIDFLYSPTEITVNFDKNVKIDITIISEIAEKIKYVNGLLQQFIQLQYKYGRYFFKIASVSLSKEAKHYLESNEYEFTIDENIMRLFLEPLYEGNNKLFVMVRELIQNSLDAAKNIAIRPNIKIDFYSNNNIVKKISILDNGVGMSTNEIKNYYLKVGSSSKKDTTEGLTGKFGIGALSSFMVGDKMRLSTKKSEHDTVQLEIKRDDFSVRAVDDVNIGHNVGNSYTYIEILVDTSKVNVSPKQVYKELNLDNIFVIDEINLKFSFIDSNPEKSNEITIPRISNEFIESAFDKIKFDDKNSFYVFNIEKFEELSENEINKITTDDFKTVLQDFSEKFRNHIVINNQINLIKFNGMNSLIRSFPLVIFSGNMNELDDLNVNLSRGNVVIGYSMTHKLAEFYLQRVRHHLSNRIDELNSNQETVMLEKLRIIDSCSSKYNTLPPKIFIKGREISLDSNQNDKILSMRINEVEPDQMELLTTVSEKYGDTLTRVKGEIKKAELGRMFSDNTIHAIHYNLILRFVISAKGSGVGLKQSALKKLFEYLEFDSEYIELNVKPFWYRKDELLPEIKERLEKKKIGEMIYFTDIGKRYSEIFSDKPNPPFNFLITSD